MKRIVASGDHHFCEHSRFEECVRVHDWMVEFVADVRPDVFLSGGDIYERASTPLERAAVAEWLTRTAEHCPVVIARGNHDRPLDVELMRRLQTKHPIIVEERAAVHVVAGTAIAAVAWPDRAGFLALHPELADESIKSALCAALRGLGQRLSEHDGPRVLLGHFMVDGSVTSTGQPLLGQPIRVGLTDLSLAKAHVGIMSHVHKFQRWDFDGVPYLYAGSPFRTTFGQTEEKVVVYAELDSSGLRNLEAMPTPATPMFQIDGSWDATEGAMPLANEPATAAVTGSEIRLRYRVSSDAREAARVRAEEWQRVWMLEGAVSVKLEEVIEVEQRSRAPEIARAQSLPEKIETLWRVRGFEPGERRDSLLSKVRQVEESCASNS